jgi:hypothetical protein
MLPENKQNEYKFDEMLKKNLKLHREPIRQEFARRLMAKLLTIEQQNTLKKVIWQERMLLSAFILLPVTVVILMLVFPSLLLSSLQLPQIIYLLMKEAAANIAQQWHLWICYVIAAAAVIYAVYESLLREN